MTQRQPAGIPAGGQFAAHARTEATAALSRPLGEVRRDFMQLRFAANDARFRLSKHAALLTVNAIKEVAPTAATAVFFHRFEDEWLHLAELRDDNGNELDQEILRQAEDATADYRAAMDPDDYFLLGHNDEDGENAYGARKTVQLRQPLTDQAAMQRELDLDLAVASTNHHDVATPLLDTLLMRFRDEENNAGVEAVYSLDSNDIYDMYERHIGPMLDGVEKEIAERIERGDGR